MKTKLIAFAAALMVLTGSMAFAATSAQTSAPMNPAQSMGYHNGYGNGGYGNGGYGHGGHGGYGHGGGCY